MFYKKYHDGADEYDREFIKKHDDDLDTTLIFVCFLFSSCVDVLTRLTGWSVLRCNFRIHHPGPAPTPAGPE